MGPPQPPWAATSADTTSRPVLCPPGSPHRCRSPTHILHPNLCLLPRHFYRRESQTGSGHSGSQLRGRPARGPKPWRPRVTPGHGWPRPQPRRHGLHRLCPARGSRGLVRLRRALLAEAREPGWREWNRVEGHQALNVEEGATAPRKSQLRAGQGAAREPLPVLVPPPRTLLPSCPGLSQAQGAPGRRQPGSHGEQVGVWLCRGRPRGPALLVSRVEERLRRPRGRDGPGCEAGTVTKVLHALPHPIPWGAPGASHHLLPSRR